MTWSQTFSSWCDRLSFPKDFGFDSASPLEDVVQALANIEKKWQGFDNNNQDMSIFFSEGDYLFCFRMRWQRQVTAWADGMIWKDETGVHVEGEAHLNIWRVLFLLLFPQTWLYVLMSYLMPDRFQHLIEVFRIGGNWRDRQSVIDEIERGTKNAFLEEHIRKQKRDLAFNIADAAVDQQESLMSRKNQR
jgi:hypothetical protein